MPDRSEKTPDANEEIDAIFIPTNRSNVWPFLLAVGALVALVGMGLKLFVVDDAPTVVIDPEVAAQTRDVLPMIESKVPTERGPWIAAVLVELLEDRVPGAVRRGLRDVQAVSPEQRNMIWMRMLASKSVRKLWQRVCHEGGDALAEVVRDGRKDGGMFMYQRCKLHKIDLLNVNRAMESGAAEILIAHAIYKHLEEAGTLTPLDIEALRLLARSSSYPTGTRPPMDAPAANTRLRPSRAVLPPPPARDYLDRALGD